MIVRRVKKMIVRLKTDEFKIRLKTALLCLWHLVFETELPH